MSVLEDNISKLDGYLARFLDTGIQNRIAGQDAAGSKGVFQTKSPVDKSLICNVAHGTAADIDRAADAAHEAFAEWRDLPATERKKGHLSDCQWDRSARRRNCTMRMLGHWSGFQIHV